MISPKVSSLIYAWEFKNYWHVVSALDDNQQTSNNKKGGVVGLTKQQQQPRLLYEKVNGTTSSHFSFVLSQIIYYLFDIAVVVFVY